MHAGPGQSADGEGWHPECYLLHFVLTFIERIGAEVCFVEDDDGCDAAFPGEHKGAFESAEVEVEVEAADEEDGVDIGGDDLFIGAGAGHLAGEGGAAGEDTADDGGGVLVFVFAEIDGDPIADGGEVGW